MAESPTKRTAATGQRGIGPDSCTRPVDPCFSLSSARRSSLVELEPAGRATAPGQGAGANARGMSIRPPKASVERPRPTVARPVGNLTGEAEARGGSGARLRLRWGAGPLWSSGHAVPTLTAQWTGTAGRPAARG